MKFAVREAGEWSEAAALRLHRPTQCLNLRVVGGGDDNEVTDVSLELVHDQVLGIVEPLAEREARRRNNHRHIPHLLVLVRVNLLDTAESPLSPHSI